MARLVISLAVVSSFNRLVNMSFRCVSANLKYPGGPNLLGLISGASSEWPHVARRSFDKYKQSWSDLSHGDTASSTLFPVLMLHVADHRKLPRAELGLNGRSPSSPTLTCSRKNVYSKSGLAKYVC